MATKTAHEPIGTVEHLKKDGTPWPFVVVRGDGTHLFADSVTELVATILRDYPIAAGDEPTNEQVRDALLKRWEASVDIATQRQQRLAMEAESAGDWDPSVEDEDTIAAVFTDRIYPFEEAIDWSNQFVPLVLLRTDYAPFTDRPLPTGNIQWIDPSDELAWMHSLDAAGVLVFAAHEAA